MQNLSLFDAADTPRSALAARLREFAARGVYIGTSSWKYPGWLGSVYTPERYMTRGVFSQKKFEAHCLTELAETFPAACADFTFYQFPSDRQWSTLFASVPREFRFGLKVPEEITVHTWPTHARYGTRAGHENASFLNAELLERMFLAPLAPYASNVGTLIFEFGTLSKRVYANVDAFARDLDRFLSTLPRAWRYAVEVRNEEYLDAPYFDALRAHNVAHVYNAWTRMPELNEQLALDAARTADFVVTRALLRRGRSFEQGVAEFQPYDRVQDVNAKGRVALREVVHRTLEEATTAFVFVNNRFEGHSPGTIQAVVDSVDASE